MDVWLFFWEINFTEAESKLSPAQWGEGEDKNPTKQKTRNGKQLLDFISMRLQLPDLTSAVHLFSILYLVFLLSVCYIQNIACSIILASKCVLG